MYAKAFIAALAGSAVVAAAGNETVVTTTEVVSKYTTYCPGPTHVTMGNKTYTVTEATTLTIVDCPCTIVKTRPVGPWTKPTQAPGPGPNNNGNKGDNNKGDNNQPGPAPNGDNNKPAPPVETGVKPITGGAEQKQAAYGLAVAGALAAIAL